LEGNVARAYLYSIGTGREVFRITDPSEELPTPAIGETVELCDSRYRVESVKVVLSLSPSSLATEYRVSVLRIEEPV
jgi:hypothetical protein